MGGDRSVKGAGSYVCARSRAVGGWKREIISYVHVQVSGGGRE